MRDNYEEKKDLHQKQAEDRAQIVEGKTKLAAHQAEENISDAGENLKEGAQRAWDMTRERASEMGSELKVEWEKGKDRIKDTVDE
ncbi:MAG: hypothetical protein LUF85_03375 [Bacteroides sp.]|nr:hypothetical protein [Bacteroides sp.]